MNWIEIMGGVVGGSGLATLIQYFRDTKKDRSDEVFRVIEQYKELINQHKSQISKMEKAEEECKFRLGKHENIIEELRVTIIELRNKMIQLETTNNDFPFPCWFKDMNHAMIWVNPACHEMIYKPNGFEEHDYIGKTDKEVWGEELYKYGI